MSIRHITPFVLATVASLAVACAPHEKEPSDPIATGSAAITGTLLGCDTLWAGQNIDAGQVCVTLGATELSIDYTTHDGWGLVEAHAWVGTNLADLPTNGGGNPQIGLFPYKASNLADATSHSFVVPLADLGELACGDVLSIAAHASVRKADGNGGYQTETGWAGENGFASGSWARYFGVDIPCEPPPEEEPELSCETAFGYGSTTFVDLGLTLNRWGWQMGPLAPGSYTQPLYAGAAQNDVSKGAEVGTVDVTYDGTTVTVSYTMDPGYTLDETHLYVGTDPVGTIAPGQFGNTHDLTLATTDTYSVGGFAGEDVYVVAHGVSCVEAAE